MISPDDGRDVIIHGEIIEDCPADQGGHSCLMLRQKVEGHPIHVVCDPKEDYLAIIQLIFLLLMNGMLILKRGKKCEMYPLPRRHEKRNSSFAY